MMKVQPSRFLIPLLLLLLGATTSLPALDIESGRMELILDEREGTFLPLYRAETAKNGRVPLLFGEDPRTSYFSLVVNNQVIRPTDSYEFEQQLERRGSGARYTWSSKRLEITQDFAFLKSLDADASNGISITLTIRNTGRDTLNLGLRYLLDTYLGEESGAHFATQYIPAVENETQFNSPPPDYILSRRNRDDNTGLMLMLRGPGLTTPDSVLLANWKRLNDSSWSFAVNRNRNFSRPPYSINDSAVALFYDPMPVGPGEERIIVLALGNYAPGGFLPERDVRDEKIENLVVGLSEEDQELGDPEEELRAVRELISEIDALIEQGEEIPEEKVYLLQQLLAALQERKQGYGE